MANVDPSDRTVQSSSVHVLLDARTSLSDSPDVSAPAVSATCSGEEMLSLQNDDGGWGFRRGQKSAVEPTSWALLALCEFDRYDAPWAQRATQFLVRTQLCDGSWPNVVGDKLGGWVTSLACLALAAANAWATEAGEGLKWLVSSWPGEGGIWWRVRHTIFGQPHLVGQDHSLRGWSWTAGTSSWVEPTACAMLALRRAEGSAAFLGRVSRRCKLAERMLLDRICPGGGWNSGNPVVYGAAGIPAVGPTCWALFALAEFANHRQTERAIGESLSWLERVYPQIQGAMSLAIASVCLRMFGRHTEEMDRRPNKHYGSDGCLIGVPALAWISFAAGPVPRWLSPSATRND